MFKDNAHNWCLKLIFVFYLDLKNICKTFTAPVTTLHNILRLNDLRLIHKKYVQILKTLNIFVYGKK